MNASQRQQKPRIAITMGDPCGVGPEILVKALCSPQVFSCCTPVVIGSPLALERAAELLQTKLAYDVFQGFEEIPDEEIFLRDGPRFAVVSPLQLKPKDMAYGRPTATTAQAVIESIRSAVEAVSGGLANAICTCPIHKANLHLHGFEFPGHTEFLQELTCSPHVVMMLAGPRLRVSLATIHHPFADVPRLLTKACLATTIRITGEALLRDFGLASARLAVAALNPHAGESGRFGREEMDLIAPVIDTFADASYMVNGPYPADTLFFRAHQGEFDAVVALYHDQGLIPIKLIHFHDAVNVSLGLPLIRTSVDHGTAYDLAGTGSAHPGSLLAAIAMAASMAENRRIYDRHAP